jgi:hypothetical protein
MKTLFQIYNLFKNYKLLKNLSWTKKGISPYILYIIGLIKLIISHPVFKIFKYVFTILKYFKDYY